MPIRKATAFTASDGSVHISIADAQQHELEVLVNRYNQQGDASTTLPPKHVANFVLMHVEEILGVLTTGPRSRPAARKAKGTTSPKRAARVAATAEQAKAGFAAMRQDVEAGRSTLTSETLDKAEKVAGLTPAA